MAGQFFQLLKKDHREVKNLLQQLMKESGDGGGRQELFTQLKKELKPHLKAEEKVFYQALMEKENAREETLEGFEEHHVTELVMREMEKISHGDERWSAKLKVLKELVDHHIKEEEGNLFKTAQKSLDPAQLTQIMEKFQKEKEKLKATIK